MRGLIRMAVALVALAGLAVVDVSPAGAHAEVCTGQGTMLVSPGLHYPVVGAAQNSSFYLEISTRPVCTGGWNGQGTLSGVLGGAYCGNAWTTSGVTNSGHKLAFVWNGSTLTLGHSPGNGTSNLVGEFEIVPDALVGESCLPVSDASGASRFIIQGWWASTGSVQG